MGRGEKQKNIKDSLKKGKGKAEVSKKEIHLLVEGKTEESFFKVMKDIEKINIKKIIIVGGVYEPALKNIKNIKKKMTGSKGKQNIILVVLDLDNEEKNDGMTEEKLNEKLKNIINYLEDDNDYNNIFFTYKNFETFLAKCIDEEKIGKWNNIDTKKIKSDPMIYSKVMRNGTIENAEKSFNENNLYYKKKDFEKAKPKKENISKIQSGLTYIVEYIEKINESNSNEVVKNR